MANAFAHGQLQAVTAEDDGFWPSEKGPGCAVRAQGLCSVLISCLTSGIHSLVCYRMKKNAIFCF